MATKLRTGNIAETSFQQWPYILLASLSLVRNPFVYFLEGKDDQDGEREKKCNPDMNLIMPDNELHVCLSLEQSNGL